MSNFRPRLTEVQLVILKAVARTLERWSTTQSISLRAYGSRYAIKAPMLNRLVDRGFLVRRSLKRGCFNPRYEFALGPMADLLKEQGVLP